MYIYIYIYINVYICINIVYMLHISSLHSFIYILVITVISVMHDKLNMRGVYSDEISHLGLCNSPIHYDTHNAFTIQCILLNIT